MKISQVELRLCSICPNRSLCLPEDEFPRLSNVWEKFNQGDFLFFKQGDFIFKDGDNADGIYIIYHGNVKVFRIDENDKEVILNNATDGDTIGFNSIIDGHYINSAKTTKNTFACFLKISEVQQLIKNKKPIAEKILAEY